MNEEVSPAIEKTKLIRRTQMHVDWLVPNEENPNEMTDAEFNMLYDNFEEVGITDPIIVRPLGKKKYRVVGGHNRLEVAKLVGFEKVPVTIIEDPDFDDDRERFQLVRHNIIRGQLSPAKFVKLYENLADKYTKEVIQESMGFVNKEEFDKLIKQVAAALPPEAKSALESSKAEIKTIEDLSKLLNKLFGVYGDSLPYGYMFLDYGGRESVWIRMEKKEYQNAIKLGTICRERQRAMDHILGGVIGAVVAGQFDELLDIIVAATPAVEIDTESTELPTLDFLEA